MLGIYVSGWFDAVCLCSILLPYSFVELLYDLWISWISNWFSHFHTMKAGKIWHKDFSILCISFTISTVLIRWHQMISRVAPKPANKMWRISLVCIRSTGLATCETQCLATVPVLDYLRQIIWAVPVPSLGVPHLDQTYRLMPPALELPAVCAGCGHHTCTWPAFLVSSHLDMHTWGSDAIP